VNPRKALAFQRWLERQPRYYSHTIMLHLMQWLGMRYLEVVRARASLSRNPPRTILRARRNPC
jgi:hypothetical protein